jgi:hypothetical protein
LSALAKDDADARDVADAIVLRDETVDLHAAGIRRKIPERILIVVDLPAPLGPMNPKSSPR